MKLLPRLLCVLGAFAAPFLVAADASDPITPAQRIELFNGRDLTGWTACLKNDAPTAPTYTVSDGLLHCTGQPFGYLRTDRTWRDYKLTVVWRYVKVAPHADNTGVFVHVQPPDHVWPGCIENQGQYRQQGDMIFLGGTSYQGPKGPAKGMNKHQGESNEKPVGEWNTYEIVCRGDTVTNSVNGRVLNHAAGCSVTSGAIALQSEGGEWELRAAFLEPLPPANP